LEAEEERREAEEKLRAVLSELGLKYLWGKLWKL
jgi:hypothetical protein